VRFSSKTRSLTAIVAALVLASAVASAARVQTSLPWMNERLSPDERAAVLLSKLAPDDQISLLHGQMAVPLFGKPMPKGAVGSAGFIAGNAKYRIPALQESDASLGVANPMNIRPGEGATALPSGLAVASTFDPQIAFDDGVMLGHEAWLSGFNVMLAGGANLARDPRNGRNFEYLGEDPLLAGTLAGAAVKGTQSEHVISTLKHFALNDQETLRQSLNAVISDPAFRESDLLAFQIAIETGKPGAIMCAYNRVNGAFACDNDTLLNEILKRDWGYAGWVMSDWGAVPGLEAASHGLDQQSGEQLDRAVYFGDPLKQALMSGAIKPERVADMSRRILRSMFAVGLFDYPPKQGKIDFDADKQVAQRAAETGIVLLKNEHVVLPLSKTVKRIAVIGGYANLGVLSGGGSAQVLPPGGTEIRVPSRRGDAPAWASTMIYQPSSPVAAMRKLAPNAAIDFDGGAYNSAASKLARGTDVAIVCATQWMTEGADAPDLSLPDGQDELISAVAAANPNTIVVLETGGPVAMPWLGQVKGVIEAWYPGARGGEAIADILFGVSNPSGRLPITFPRSVEQLPRPQIPGLGLPFGSKVDVNYNIEGADVGYRWFARQGLKPAFPFGFGLSYTSFALSDLTAQGGKTMTATFKVSNTGAREGAEVAQLYLLSPNKRRQRLVGFAKVDLKPGESKSLTIEADRRLLANYDEAAHKWRINAGTYKLGLGNSSENIEATAEVVLEPALF